MIEVKGHWELAKAMTAATPSPEWRRAQQWEIANAKAAEMREAGHIVTVEADAAGNPVMRVGGQ